MKVAGKKFMEQSICQKLNLQQAYIKINHILYLHSIQDSQLEANMLINHVVNKDRRVFADYVLSDEQTSFLNECIKKRCERVPLQYILGEWDFLDFTLKVGQGVLIPRSDTEIVCNTAIETALYFYKNLYSEKCAVKIADLCAGSGAIAIGVKRKLPFANVTAIELSKKALFYLTENIKSLAPDIKVINDDVFKWQNTLNDGEYDIIVSNPPYVTHAEMKKLQAELYFEPKMALYAKEDGLAFYKHIAKEYKQKLKKGGAVIFEIGSTQAQKVTSILKQNNYENIQVFKDISGCDRCIKAVTPYF